MKKQFGLLLAFSLMLTLTATAQRKKQPEKKDTVYQPIVLMQKVDTLKDKLVFFLNPQDSTIKWAAGYQVIYGLIEPKSGKYATIDSTRAFLNTRPLKKEELLFQVYDKPKQ